MRLGHTLELRPLRLRTGFHTLDRWLYNAGVALRPPVGADLVYGVDLDGFLWARRRKLPFVVSLKGVIADELKNERGWVRVLLSVQARWERRNARRADLVLVPTRYSEGVARRLYDLEPSKLAVLPEPIDLDGWTARFVAAQARPRTGATVLCVARMYPRKRIVDLLEAAALLRGQVPALVVRIVGKGPEWETVRRRHQALDLGETVTLLGDVSPGQLAEEYVSADLFCLPSVQESFGIVFLEDGVTGVLVPPRDPAALANALEALLGDPARAHTMGAAGRRAVAAYGVERVAGRFLDAVRLVVGGMRSR